MNLREGLYVSGGGFVVRHVYPRGGGRRVAVLDPSRRTKTAILILLRRGLTPRQVARALDIPAASVFALGLALAREKRLEKIPRPSLT